MIMNPPSHRILLVQLTHVTVLGIIHLDENGLQIAQTLAGAAQVPSAHNVRDRG